MSEATLHSPEARSRGKSLFNEHCVLCHGEAADGRGRRHEGLVGRPTDFTSPSWRAEALTDGVFDAIRNGKPGTSMPAWRSLADDDVADLTAYVLQVNSP